MEFLGHTQFGVGLEHDFKWAFVPFLVAQNLADVDIADCLIDRNVRQMLPHFVAPLTSRGRQLVQLGPQPLPTGSRPHMGHCGCRDAEFADVQPDIGSCFIGQSPFSA